jgi:AraC-like DNA-binding protein
MPIYMDVHNVPGVEAGDVAAAHQKDMQIQHDFHCNCITYWIDIKRNTVFCLIDAPDMDAVQEMHRSSHGLVPHKIIEVQKDIVNSFLGRIYDPEDAVVDENGLKVFTDSAFRFLLVTDVLDSVLLQHQLGKEQAEALLNRQSALIRKRISLNDGREVEHPGNGFIISFSSSVQALTCALEIQKGISDEDKEKSGFKIGLSAGEPVKESDTIFGDVIRSARNLFTVSDHKKIVLTAQVQKLLPEDVFFNHKKQLLVLLPSDEHFIDTIFAKLEQNWQEPDFGIEEFCKVMSMSNSQLYRKSMALWGLAPNLLLKEFRLHKARELLRSHQSNISQTTFDAGFNSPSYFTKCFKKRFGILPAAYLTALHSV